MSFHRFRTRDDLDAALAAHLLERLSEDILQQGSASLAVSGGSTPKNLFSELAQSDLDWRHVVITLVDERWVPPDHEDSNARLVAEHLLQSAAAAATFIPLYSDYPSATSGVAATRDRLARIPRPFSAVVLGMGGDGHTASWFPQADNLADLIDPDQSESVMATHPVTAPHERITLTLPAVLNTRDLLLHITGDEKRAVLESAERNDYPVAAIQQQNHQPLDIYWAP